MEIRSIDDNIDYKPDQFGVTARGLAAIGHELTHVQQWHQDPHFLAHYVGSAVKGFFKPGDTHDNISAEQAAIAMENRIELDLAGRYGLNDVCQSFFK